MQVAGLGEFDSRGRVLTMRLRTPVGFIYLAANAMCRDRQSFVLARVLHLSGLLINDRWP